MTIQCLVQFIISPQYTIQCQIIVNNQTLPISLTEDISTNEFIQEDQLKQNVLFDDLVIINDLNDIETEETISNEIKEIIETKQIEQKEIKHYEYNSSLYFNQNIIQINEISQNNNDNEAIHFLQDLFQNPTDFKQYEINYQHIQYQFLSESLLSILFNFFIERIEKKMKITECQIIIQQENCNELIFDRLYESLTNINIPHQHQQQNELLKTMEERYVFQESLLNEFFSNKHKFDSYNNRILKAKEIIEMKYRKEQTQHLKEQHEFFQLLDYNSIYNKENPFEIGYHFTTKERAELHLYEIDHYCIFIASRYFNSLDDYLHLEFGCKRFYNNRLKFHYNPISLSKEKFHLFPNIQTIYFYDTDFTKISNKMKVIKKFYDVSLSINDYLDIPKSQKKSIEFRSIKMKRRNMIDYDDIPSYVNEINSFDCYDCELINISIPNTIKRIRKRSFFNFVSLTSITIPTTITILEDETFYGCKSLISIDLPSTLEYIGKKCFANCSNLKEISIPHLINLLGFNVFEKCENMKRMKTNKNWKIYGNRIFNETNNHLCSIEIPTSLTSFNDEQIIVEKNLTTYKMSSSIVTIHPYCFAGCSHLIPFSLPSSVVSIGQYAFYSCPWKIINNQLVNNHMYLQPLLFDYQINQLEELCQLKYKETIFDSDIDDWSLDYSIFDKRIFNRRRIVILIEDKHHNLFGIYIDTLIDKYFIQTEEHQWKGSKIDDKNAFIFSLYSNGRSSQPLKFPIQRNQQNKAFTLYDSSYSSLFCVGSEDLIIGKENFKGGNWGNPSSFDYRGMENILTGKEGKMNPFIVERIQVYQMIQTTEQIKAEELYYQNQFEKETKALEQLSLNLLISNQLQIRKIEQLFGLNYSELLFDNSVCNWNQFTSTFDKRIIGKEHIVILIEDKKKHVFGCYIDSKIHSTSTNISDSNAFLFTMKLIGTQKFPIFSKHSSNAFLLSNKDSRILFSIGDSDIIILKHNMMTTGKCEQKSFNYNGKLNVLVGNSHPFDVERIQVIQMVSNQNEMNIPLYTNNIQINTKLINSTIALQNSYSRQIELLEKTTETTFESIIFDSSIHKWKSGSSEFNNCILGKKNIIVLCEDTNKSLFGGYISCELNKEYFDSNLSISNKCNFADENAFLFCLKQQTKDFKQFKLHLSPKQRSFAFTLYDDNSPELFSFGKEWDLIVYKQNIPVAIKSIIQTYNANNSKNSLFESFSSRKCLPKRIYVLQMHQNEDFEELKKKQNQKKYLEESKQIKEQTPFIISTIQHQLHQIEEWSKTHFHCILFDSKICDWYLFSSTFHQRILGKENIVILIEQENGIYFGVYLRQRIQRIIATEYNGELNGSSNSDENAFLFSFNLNQEPFCPITYHIKPEHSSNAFTLFDEKNKRLFIVGDEDICVNKNTGKKGWIKQKSFDYRRSTNVLFGDQQEEFKFITKRILVFQMEDNNLHQQLSRIELSLLHSQDDQFNKETSQLKSLSQTIFYCKSDELLQIESLCQKTIVEYLFDSLICDWNQGISTFDRRIFGKEHVVIVFEDMENNIFGCYIDSKIDKYSSSTNEMIHDSKAFIFSLESNNRLYQPTQFMINPENQQEAFSLYSSESPNLLMIGKNDIVIRKHNILNKNTCCQNSFYYQGKENILIGKENDKSFELKRIVVWQMN